MADHGDIVARIQKARCDLYVYEDSPAKEKWRDLLDQAYEALIQGKEQQASELVGRVEAATANLWLRISRWNKIQARLTVGIGAALVVQLISILLFLEQIFSPNFGQHVVAVIFGLLGGTMSTLFSLGDNLSIDGSNRLGLIRSLIRPIVGCFNALIAALLLSAGILTIPSTTVTPELVAVVGAAAGLTERYVTNKLTGMIG